MKNLVVFFLVVLSFTLNAYSQMDEWSGLDKTFGKKGTVKEGVWKLTFPRSDLKVKVGSFSVDPGLALTSWIGIVKAGGEKAGMGNSYMMMGDLVLLESEIYPVLMEIGKQGLPVTAIHNHLINESPALKYLHFSGKGENVKLAEAIKKVIQVTKTPLTNPSPAQSTSVDWSKVEAVLGKGTPHGKLIQFSFPRKEKTLESGMEMPPAIGMATGINFQMEGNRAAVAGDFVLLADEVNPVLRALTENGITVTAIHNHMLYDNPRLFMMHLWAVDDPEKLANGVKAALDKTNSEK